MRKSKTCPKCQSADVIRIPGSVEGYGAGNNILLRINWWKSRGYVKVSRYVCGACGFSEEWIDAPEDIARLKEHFGAKTA